MNDLNLSVEEKNLVFRLNNHLELNFSKKDLQDFKNVKRTLIRAWENSDETLHNWGFSRLKVASLCSRLSGFDRFIFRRATSIYGALEKTRC
jgi:hypothetical protein